MRPVSPRRLAQSAANGPIFYLIHSHRAAQQARHRGHPFVGDAAGDDQVELREVGVHVEREAVARHPARDAHADRRELGVLPTQMPVSPAMRPASMPNARDGPDQHLLEVAHVTVHVAAIRLQIDDRIADELTGTVVGDVAAAAGLEQADAAPPRAPQARSQDVRQIVAGLDPECDDGGCSSRSS